MESLQITTVLLSYIGRRAILHLVRSSLRHRWLGQQTTIRRLLPGRVQCQRPWLADQHLQQRRQRVSLASFFLLYSFLPCFSETATVCPLGFKESETVSWLSNRLFTACHCIHTYLGDPARCFVTYMPRRT